MRLERQLKGKETFSKLLLPTAFTIWSRKGPNKQNTRPGKHRQKTGKKRARRDGLARSASHCAAKWGAENLLQSSLGHREKWLKGFCFFFLPLWLLLLFSQKCQFHQSFDNYETCQLIVRIHQMCQKRQEMRSRILKLDGFQKSLTITVINHPGTSIFGCRKFCREQKMQENSTCLKEVPRSECERLMLYCQDCLSSYRGCSYAEPRRYDSSSCHDETTRRSPSRQVETGGPSPALQSSWDLGIHTNSSKRSQPPLQRGYHLPCPRHSLCSTEVRTARKNSTAKGCTSLESQDEKLGLSLLVCSESTV